MSRWLCQLSYWPAVESSTIAGSGYGVNSTAVR